MDCLWTGFESAVKQRWRERIRAAGSIWLVSGKHRGCNVMCPCASQIHCDTNDRRYLNELAVVVGNTGGVALRMAV